MQGTVISDLTVWYL